MSSEDFPFTLMDLEQAQVELYNKQRFYSTRQIAFSLIPSYSSAPAVGQNLSLLLFKLSVLLRSWVLETNKPNNQSVFFKGERDLSDCQGQQLQMMSWTLPDSNIHSLSEEWHVDFIPLLVSKLGVSYLLATFSFKNISYLGAVAGAQTNTQVEKTTETFYAKQGWM